MKLKNHSILGNAERFTSLSVPSVSSVVKSSVSLSDSGSALILVLLITALLATIAVSFLSTSRVEQMATRNFSRQNAASGLADLATGQAMATIQSAFNGNGTGTGIVVTQPGAISKYFFSNGNCTNASNATTNLFYTSNSANANGTVNMNNLFANSTVSGLITGNASETITVASVNVLSGNQVIGKVAYYVDDELTKINLNSAAGNRTTLNFSYGKAASLSGAANFTGNITNFDAVINGTASSNSSNLSTWTSFFRPEQARTVLGLNATQMANYSTAPLSDFHLKYTPWGTRRLFINDEPITDAGVTNIYSALSGLDASGNPASSSSTNPYEINGMALRNIYNGTFSDKYSSNGTLQIAANMLQMKDRNTVDLNLNWSGAILGSGNLSGGIPQSYLAFTPSAVINEVAIQPEQDLTNNTLNICVYVELWAPFFNFISSDNKNYGLEVNLQSASGTSITGLSNQTINRSISPLGNTNYKKVEKFTFSANATDYNGTLNITMGDIKLLATPGNASSIRDWISGSVINSLLPINRTLNSTTTVNYTASSPWNANANMTSIQRKDIRIKYDSTGVYSINNNSTTSPWGVALHSLISSTTLNQISNSTSTSGPTMSNNVLAGDIAIRNNPPQIYVNAISTSFTEYGYFTSDWPADHLSQGTELFNFRFFNFNRYFCPTLFTKDSNGNGLFIWPGDLGKVMTDRMYRTLRMYWQPTQERARGFIPDWALLDLISFSSNNSANFPIKIAPINLNGKFNCAAAPTPQPRNNIQCLTKPFDVGGNLTSSIAKTVSPKSYDNMYPPGLGGNNGWLGAGAGVSNSISSNITKHITSNSSIAWTKNGTNSWSSYRTNWPSNQLILPAEIAEIRSVADFIHTPIEPGSFSENDATTEANENRLAAFFPGLTFCSNFFTIYAYAQALDKNQVVDSEALTKTLVEVVVDTPATATSGAVYKVKKLYTQPIPLGQ